MELVASPLKASTVASPGRTRFPELLPPFIGAQFF
jgi:hypothetical protein